MATKTQEIFSCICDEHVTEEEPFKLLKKEAIITDMKMRAAISDFHPVKQIVLVSHIAIYMFLDYVDGMPVEEKCCHFDFCWVLH